MVTGMDHTSGRNIATTSRGVGTDVSTTLHDRRLPLPALLPDIASHRAIIPSRILESGRYVKRGPLSRRRSSRLVSSLTPGCDGFVRLEEAPRVLHDLVDVLLRTFQG